MTRSRNVLSITVIVMLLSSGCLTLSPSVTADTSESPVFQTISTDEPWAGHHVRVTATLRSTSKAGNVTTITVVDEQGRPYDTIDVETGQTIVVLWVPTNQRSTLVASNSVNSTTISKFTITSGGNRVI